MSRSFSLKNTVFSILLVAGCDNAANEPNKAMGGPTEANNKITAASDEDSQKASNAQTAANEKIVVAAGEAAQKAKDAQLAADTKMAAAQDNFLKLREDYRHSTEANLIELDDTVARIEIQAKKETGKVRADFTAKLKLIHAQRETFASHFKLLANEVATTWDDAKVRLDKEWSDLKATVYN